MHVQDFVGKFYYQVGVSETFDEYLKHLGISFYKRKMAKITSTEVNLDKKGEDYLLQTNTRINVNSTTPICPKEKTNYQRLDGAHVTSTWTIDGNVIHEQQTLDNGKVAYVDRVFTEKEMKMTLKIDDIEAAMYYTAK